MGIPSRREATHELTQTQCALSNAARGECNTERKLHLAMQSQLMREAAQAFVPA